MKFYRTGYRRDNFLSEQTTIKPVDQMDEILFTRFNYFIGFIKNNLNLERVIKYFRELADRFYSLCDNAVYYDLDHFLASEHQELLDAAYSYYLHLLGISKLPKSGEEYEINMKQMIEAWLFPSYYLLETLSNTIGREYAIDLFKTYISNYHEDHPSPGREKFKNLECFLSDKLSGDTSSSIWEINHTMLEEGKYAFKNLNCPTCADTMVSLPDIEFRYLVACYGDFGAFTANLGDHIQLTMEHTIIKGDSYCSRVLHDTKISTNLWHPPKEFWDNFEPGSEIIANKYL
ncbi:MAG: hypothetical protein INQ03_12410 [Candidatus Heimdallarchaeota archaeon]|nr:hypothetical protein [Candidatus Heimdallarchaeota archaeon]